MAETTMVSERDAVKRERAATVRTWLTIAAELRAHGDNHSAELVSSRFAHLADELYPLPKVERIRRIPDPHWPSLNWSVVNGILHSQYHSTPSEPSTSPVAPTPKRVAVWADLFANPTEFVEDDGSAAASPEGR